ncbi:MAG: hypothetical protein ACI4HN_08635 [Ruminococcus sp.]
MKKEYESPEFEFFKFEIRNELLTGSGETDMMVANGGTDNDDFGYGEDFF